jgi:competence protein ComEC
VTLLGTFPVDELLYGEQLSIDASSSLRLTQCVAGHRWRSDGVVFQVLHPDRDSRLTGNNASCVVEVRAGANRVLLAADIERPVELMLAARGTLAQAELVVVPHHGSRTSSSAPFVAALKTKFAVVSAGYGNRWGFPRPDVVDRWEQSGAIVLTTAASGALSQRLCSHLPLQPPREQRREYRRYWHASRR